MNYKDMADTFSLDRRRILFYLAKADELLAEMGEELTVYVSGGANMCLYVGSRDSTSDIDTTPSNEALLRKLAGKMQTMFSLPNNWLNPSGTIFVTERMMTESVLGLDFPNLKVYFLSFKCMLVLKVLAARSEMDKHDMQDTIALLIKLKIKSLAEVSALVDEYKPAWNNQFVMSFAKEALELAWPCLSEGIKVQEIHARFDKAAKAQNHISVLSDSKVKHCETIALDL